MRVRSNPRAGPAAGERGIKASQQAPFTRLFDRGGAERPPLSGAGCDSLGSADAGKRRCARVLVPWNRDDLHKSRSAAPGSQGATTEHIGHM